MSNIPFREFIEHAPTCSYTTTVEEILQIFSQTGGDRLVLVDGHQSPVGLLPCRAILPVLMGARQIGAPPAGVSEAEGQSHQVRLQSAVLPWLEQAQSEGIEPLLCLSIDWTLEQLYWQCHTATQRQWALVDASGCYLGLIDQTRFWQWQAQQGRVPSPSPTPLLTQQGYATDLHLPPQASLDGRDLSLLLNLLEQLPLPLMLQTDSGRVLSQNRAWQTQVGELQDPGSVRQEVAALLESHGQASEPAGAAANNGLTVGERLAEPMVDPANAIATWAGSNLSAFPTAPGLQPGAGSASAIPDSNLSPSFCRLGSSLNSCVCICPMKNGQERVWQFIKVPLIAAVSQSPRSPSAFDWVNGNYEAELQAPSDFYLAPLRKQPASAWAVLAPTEVLWLILAQDNTEQQQVARELAAKNADLAQLNRLKDEFLACISHELKTPLTAILGLSTLLKDQLLGPLNQRQSRYAQLIHRSGRHLVLIVNDILDLTRIETGQLELMPEPIQIKDVCNRAYAQVQKLQPIEQESSGDEPNQPLSSIRFSLKIQPDLETLVADDLRLRQMLINLLSNAFKFTEADGEVGLIVEQWENWIAFTVWDRGIGIPADKQHLIFQKFQQLEHPLTRRFEGTGLGLVLAQRLARLHGGDITFTSTEGQGSQFTLLLPPQPPQATPATHHEVRPDPSGTAAPISTASNRLVLVVEAVPRFLDNLTQQLLGLGYRVAIARSGTEALEKIRRLQPAVVFLNPLLPLLSGWDVLTLLRTDDATRRTTVIMTATRGEKRQAYASGADGFLSLPVQTKALQRSLERLMSEPSAPKAPFNLTLLHLHIGESSRLADTNAYLSPEARPSPVPLSIAAHIAHLHPLTIDLNSLLHPYNCRVLEVDDLEQAELLVRVWKPDVMLLDGTLPEPMLYLKQLSQHPFLAALPLVTLTPEMTAAANRVGGLAVFPCLAPLATAINPDSGQPETSDLLEVIQVAAGMGWSPHILLADVSSLLNGAQPLPGSTAGPQYAPHHRLQAAAQYIQTAGFRSSIATSWSDVLQQLQHQSVDVLLLHIDSDSFQPKWMEGLQVLEHINSRAPVLVWPYAHLPSLVEPASPMAAVSPGSTATFMERLTAIATQVLPATLSMTDLLLQVNQVLGRSNDSSNCP